MNGSSLWCSLMTSQYSKAKKMPKKYLQNVHLKFSKFRIFSKNLSAFSESISVLSLSLVQPTGANPLQIVFESHDADKSQMRDLSMERLRFEVRRPTDWLCCRPEQQ